MGVAAIVLLPTLHTIGESQRHVLPYAAFQPAASIVDPVVELIQPKVVGDTVGLSITLTFLSLVFWTFVIGPLGALLAAVNIGVRANAQWGPRIFTAVIRGQVTGPDAAALLATRPDAAEASRWWLQAITVPPGYVAALAVEITGNINSSDAALERHGESSV